jgi:hypothetical protein
MSEKLFQLWKESLRRYGQQFHQYQQNKQSSVTLTHWTQKGGTRDTSTSSNQNTVYVYIVLDTVCQLSSIGTGKFYNHKTRQIDVLLLLIFHSDELSIDINKLIFEVKTHVCEKLPSQKKIIEGK